jgi:hypothetical protein
MQPSGRITACFQDASTAIRAFRFGSLPYRNNAPA